MLSVVGMVNGSCKPCNQDAFVVQEIAMNGATATLLGALRWAGQRILLPGGSQPANYPLSLSRAPSDSCTTPPQHCIC